MLFVKERFIHDQGKWKCSDYLITTAECTIYFHVTRERLYRCIAPNVCIRSAF